MGEYTLIKILRKINDETKSGYSLDLFKDLYSDLKSIETSVKLGCKKQALEQIEVLIQGHKLS